MKITLESTDREDNKIKITIEVNSDDLDIYEVVDDLLRPALIAYGFHPDCVKEALKYEDCVDFTSQKMDEEANSIE